MGNADPVEQLLILLRRRREIDTAIAGLLRESFGVRFSAKKFVGDLGEYYFFRNVPNFVEQLEQSTTSNNGYDFKGVLTLNGASLLEMNPGEVRIEVKTRHAQEGNNHLKGLHPEKFDLLAFVALADDFSCRHIGMIRSIDITVDRQNRIRYSDYYRKDLVRWKTTDWVEL